jgi:5-methylcytosine-specific restriction enzyme A
LNPRFPERPRISDLPRGSNGRALCRQCAQEVPPRRRSFCSQACIAVWRERSDYGYQVSKVLERDGGRCEMCGLDCVALFDELRRLFRAEAVEIYGARAKYLSGPAMWTARLPRFELRIAELGLPRSLRGLTRRFWEMDHRVPVAEGGGSCGLENLRTLCWRCHGDETVALAKRRAARRRETRS